MLTILSGGMDSKDVLSSLQALQIWFFICRKEDAKNLRKRKFSCNCYRKTLFASTFFAPLIGQMKQQICIIYSDDCTYMLCLSPFQTFFKILTNRFSSLFQKILTLKKVWDILNRFLTDLIDIYSYMHIQNWELSDIWLSKVKWQN